MVTDLEKIKWIKVNDIIHKMSSTTNLSGNDYIVTDCGSLVSANNGDSIKALADDDAVEFNMKKKGDFCFDCRKDVDPICEYE